LHPNILRMWFPCYFTTFCMFKRKRHGDFIQRDYEV